MFIYLNNNVVPVVLPEVEAARITRDLERVKHSRNQATRATLDYRRHGAEGWSKTRRVWTRHGDNCETWSMDSINAAAARAAADLAASDVAFFEHKALLIEDAKLHARAADPLAYSSDFGYIEA